MKYCKKNEPLVKPFQTQKLASVNKWWQVKLGNNYFMCLYSDLQSATKWVETLRPKLGFFHFTDFKRVKYSFSSPIPSMQCCATVWATCTYRQEHNKHPNFEWTGQGRGVDSFVLWSYPICLNNCVANCSWACFGVLH